MSNYQRLLHLERLGALTTEQQTELNYLKSGENSSGSTEARQHLGGGPAASTGGTSARKITNTLRLYPDTPSWWGQPGSEDRGLEILTSLAPLDAPPPRRASLETIDCIPFPPPSSAAHRKAKLIYPSLFNALTFTSPEIPAAHRIFYAVMVLNALNPGALDLGREWSIGATQSWLNTMAGISKATKESWGSAIRSYLDWAGMEGIEDKNRFPVSLINARMFLSAQVGLFRVETLKKKVISLREFSKWASIPESRDGWNFDLNKLSPVLSAAATNQPHPHLKRKPLLSQQMTRIVDLVSNGAEDHFDTAMLAVTVVGFTCLLRSGEFTFKGINPSEDEKKKKAKGKHIKKIVNVEGYNIHLPWDKVKKWEGAAISVVDGALSLPAATLLRKHLELNKIGLEDFIWSYVAGKGKNTGDRVLINKKSWETWFNAKLGKIGEKPLNGHSIRIGGATQLLLNGTNPDVIKTLGRWSAKTSFYKYWRHVNALVSLRLIGSENVDVPAEEDVEGLVQ